MDPISAILGLASGGMNIWGLLNSMHQQNWINDFAINELNNKRQAQQTGFGMWQSAFDPARDMALGLKDWYGNALFAPNGSQDQLIQAMSGYPGVMQQALYGNPFEAGATPGMNAVMQQNLEQRPYFSNIADTANQVFQGGGWSQPRQDQLSFLLAKMTGQDPSMANALDVGNNLLSNRGENEYTTDYQKMAKSVMGTGGMNDLLTQAQGIANQAGQRGLDLLNREALLSNKDIFNWTREDASRNAFNAYEKARRDAINRGMGSASVMKGATLDDEYIDSLANSVSTAGRDALNKQQGLGLQQMGLGSQTALGGGSLMPTTQNAATGLVNTYADAGSRAGALANARMGTGNSLLDMLSKYQLGYAGQYGGALGDMQNYALGAGNLGINAGNAYQNAGNQYFNNFLNSGQFGAQLGLNQMSGYNQYFNNLLGLNRDNMTNYGMGLTGLVNLGGQGLTYGTAGLGAVAPPSYINNQGQYANIAQGLSQFMPKISTGGGNYTPVPGMPPVSSGPGIAQPNGGSWIPPGW